jgi:hypothetical protein
MTVIIGTRELALTAEIDFDNTLRKLSTPFGLEPMPDY